MPREYSPTQDWSSRCLWKRLDEMLQSIFSEKNFKNFLPPKRPPKIFWGSKHVTEMTLAPLFFQVTGFLKPVMGSVDPGVPLSD